MPTAVVASETTVEFQTWRKKTGSPAESTAPITRPKLASVGCSGQGTRLEPKPDCSEKAIFSTQSTG